MDNKTTTLSYHARNPHKNEAGIYGERCDDETETKKHQLFTTDSLPRFLLALNNLVLFSNARHWKPKFTNLRLIPVYIRIHVPAPSGLKLILS